MDYQLKEHEQIVKDDNVPYLSNLINQLNDNIKNNKNIKSVKNPKKLLESLIKLHNIVGMKDIKESIARQTSYLINKLNHGENSLKMLNTVLYGPQGVGKTTVGVILAEIWHHLGFLEKAANQKNSMSGYLSKLSSYNTELLQFYFIIGMFVGIQLYDHVLKPLYKLYGYNVIIASVLLLLLFIYLYQYEQVTNTTESDMIVITSRSTFVNMYLGGTAPQTENFLKENKGKVVFIDEAYSLYNGYNDNYGSEALSSINKFMSEHEDEIVIIFAGYEDMLKSTIFKVQPGLDRRCMWKFNCNTYDGQELYEIFKLQLKKEKYEIHTDDLSKINELIIKYQDQFCNNAGSTEQLAFFSQLNHSSRLSPDKIIIYEDVKNGLKELIKNNLSPAPQSDLMSEFKKLYGH